MSEELKAPAVTPTEKSDKAPASGKDDGNFIPKSRLDEVIAQREAEKQIVANLQKQLAELQSAQKQAQDAALAEQGKYKELAEKQKLELEQLKKIADQHNAYLERLKEANTTKRQAIPKEYQDLLAPALPDPMEEAVYLERFIAKLPEITKKAPAFPAGGKAGQGGTIDEELATMERRYAELAGKYDQASQVERLSLKDAIFKKRMQTK